MCGIVGIYNFDNSKISKNELKKFNNSLTHRGPDAEGYYFNKIETLGFGHRRLSIIDTTSEANQPMSYDNDRYTIVFNGEIYNFIELKSELINLGFKFKTSGDTEVILASYIAWGENCQLKFNGMWAFAIWDSLKKKIFISRDRFGVKPIYYLINNNYLYFASELKAFMHIKKENIPDFKYSNFIYSSKDHSNNSYEVTEETFLNNVKELNPGHQLIIDTSSQCTQKKWWSTIDNLIEIPKNYNDQLDHFKTLFFNSCKLRMRSDVKIATSLSGGIDSSSIVATINNFKSSWECLLTTSFPYETYILDYKNEINNETEYAKEAIKNSEVIPQIIELELNKVDPEEIIKTIYHQEEVTGDDGLGPWSIYKNMKKNNVKVSIDGHGGDELMAGYSGYPRLAMKECNFPGDIKKWLDYLSIHLKMNDKSENENHILKLILKKSYNLLMSKGRKQKNKDLNNYDFFTAESSNPLKLPQDKIENLSLLNRSLYVDYHYKAMQLNLKKYDKFAMAHGVESRFPFLDYNLAQYLFSLPTTSKIKNGFTKRILRDSMKGIVPEKILNRVKKKGFNPTNELFNKTMINFVNDTINSKEFVEFGIWDGKKIKSFINNRNNIDYKKMFKYIQIYYLEKTFKKKIYN